MPINIYIKKTGWCTKPVGFKRSILENSYTADSHSKWSRGGTNKGKKFCLFTRTAQQIVYYTKQSITLLKLPFIVYQMPISYCYR